MQVRKLSFIGFWAGALGWTLMAVTMGLVQWRVWYVADMATITSGVAWVGIWRACFLSRTLVTSEFDVLFCQAIRISDTSTPVEISLAQVLVPVALVVGIGGNASAVYALRRVYFGLHRHKPLRVAFSMAGSLYLVAGMCSLLPLAWNMSSVVANRTIDFPSDFHLPPAPLRQEVGAGIVVGIVASLMVIIGGMIFLTYRIPSTPPEMGCSSSLPLDCSVPGVNTPPNGTASPQSGASQGDRHITNSRHTSDNPAFESWESI
uniref:Claudin-34-like n=1 Tax=Scleropages formosus TaxID=113540 RepID=A0A8C9QXS6_SCLFO